VDVLIIGGGIAGSAAALRAAQYHLRTTWIRGDAKTAKRSRAQWVVNIDNMVGVHDGAVKQKVLRLLEDQPEAYARVAAEHFHIGGRELIANTLERIRADFDEHVTIVEAAAISAERDDGGFLVKTADAEHRAPRLVLATGVMDRQPSIARRRGDTVVDAPKWVYPFANRESVLYCIRCEGHLTRDTRAAVIGAGEAAAQLALMLHERYGSGAAVLTNGESPAWAPDTGRLLSAYGIAVSSARIVDLVGGKGELREIVLEDEQRIEVRFALVSMGLFRVYNQLAIELGAELEAGEAPVEERHVLVDARGETSVPELFAIGDMIRRPDEPVMKQVYTSQEYAVRAIDTVDRRVRAARRRAILESLPS
jgi:thioredoxin reductase (NADPH)